MPDSPQAVDRSNSYALASVVAERILSVPLVDLRDIPDPSQDRPGQPQHDTLLVLLPLLIVLSSFLFILLLFLLCVLLIRRRRGIILRDNDGPVDMSREEYIEGEGGFEGIESRWLESVDESVRRSYLRAKEYQLQYPPNSIPSDITLSQFLTIQEKGVSAWCFEPDFETVNYLLVHTRTEITFLPDPASASCVQSNLPLPKLNEVYYWEVKMFDLPESTTVAVGLATKPYPPFRLPGLSRQSVAYHSNGDKSHNFPFTATSFGPSLKEGDVLGVGYRPRTGTVFFTRNGRKLDDAFIGLSRWNLFPTIGADGPCSVHVNLGQAGFVFIEANVKKWGLAPSVGTLAPPPAYGSERGSILLDVGGGIRPRTSPHSPQNTPSASSPTPSGRPRRVRRPKRGSTAPVASSPLRESSVPSHFSVPLTPPPPITPIDEELDGASTPGASASQRYMSPTDLPFHTPPRTNLPLSPPVDENTESQEDEEESDGSSTSSSRSPSQSSGYVAGSDLTIQVLPPPDTPRTPNPPTPDYRDIHLMSLTPSTNSEPNREVPQDALPPHTAALRRDPPAYSPLDAYTYSDGVQIDLPAEVIAAALEGNSVSPLGSPRPDRRRTRRR